MNEMLTLLKAPFPVEKLSWRVGQKSKDGKKAMMLVYIDSRDVQDRLDEVCGSGWSDTYSSVNGRTVCSITINGVTRTDGAGDTDFEGEKGGLSDAFKRAAVKWGVGRYLYDAKQYNTWVNCEGLKDYEIYEKNKDTLDMVASKLGKNVQTYNFYLIAVKLCESKEQLEVIRDVARAKAKSEGWNMGNLETFKKAVETKQKEFKEEE